jgi:hypothetical protein
VEQDKQWMSVHSRVEACIHPSTGRCICVENVHSFQVVCHVMSWCIHPLSWCHDIVQRGFCLCFHARDTNARVTIEVRVEAIMEAGMVLESSTHHISHVRRHVTIYDSIASCVILESIYNLVMEYVIIAWEINRIILFVSIVWMEKEMETNWMDGSNWNWQKYWIWKIIQKSSRGSMDEHWTMWIEFEKTKCKNQE